MYMKISTKLEPIVNGFSAGLVNALLALLTFKAPFGVWLIFSFVSYALILFVFLTASLSNLKIFFLDI